MLTAVDEHHRHHRVEEAHELGVGVDDTLILRGDKVDDATTLTLAPRMQKNLVLLERVAREVSL